MTNLRPLIQYSLDQIGIMSAVTIVVVSGYRSFISEQISPITKSYQVCRVDDSDKSIYAEVIKNRSHGIDSIYLFSDMRNEYRRIISNASIIITDMTEIKKINTSCKHMIIFQP